MLQVVVCEVCIVDLLTSTPFPADNFGKNHTKLIPNIECILYNLLKTVYFESDLIHLQQC